MKLKLIPLYPALFLFFVSCAPVQHTTYSKVEDVYPRSKIAKKNKETTRGNNANETSSAAYNQLPSFNAKPSRHAGGLNISVHDVDAREFFMGLVVDTDENMMVHPEVSGNISLELKHVSIEQVMEAVQKVYGYDYKKSNIGYIVYPATLQTRTFKINRLDLLREGRSSTRVSSGQLDSQGNNSASNPSNNGAQQYPSNSPSDNNQENSKPSGSSIDTTTETDFWKELDDALHSIVAVDKQATVVVNKQSGTVIARAKPMQLREIESFIDTTQNQISRQVILEAKIVEIILDDGHQAGVNWESIVREGLNKAPLLTGVGTIGALNASVFTLGARAGDFGAYVELLETQGTANILSSPRISTLNNQKAIIKVGRDEYFITQVSSNIVTTSATSIVNPNVTFTPFFSGIALDVTPQIDDRDEITMHIHPSITRVESQIKDFTINGQAGSVPMALNTVRESDSIVKAQNGQIIMLGGLMQETSNENKEGVAGLTRIPFLGNLFRVNTGKTQKSELVILLKPTLINNDSDWQNTIAPSREHFEQLEAQPRWK